MNDHFLVVRFSSLGDILLTSPTVLNLRLAHPSARITYLTKEAFAPLVREFDGVDDVVTIDNKAGLWSYYRTLMTLDRTRVTTVIDLHGNPRSWLARKLITADRTTTYPKRHRERHALTRRHGKQFPADLIHTIDAYNESLSLLNIALWADRPVLPQTAFADEELLTVPHPIVAIAPGAAHAPKQYGVEHFAKIAARMQHDCGAHIVWLATANERLSPDTPANLDRLKLTEIIDRPLRRVAALLRQADVTIANDSGIAHLSSAVGTPVVAVFGPTHPALGFAPRGLHDRVAEVTEFCRPCSLHGATPCYRTEQFCFTKLHPEAVLAEVAELLVTHADAAPALFVDRDGTVIKEKHFLKDPEQVELEPGAAGALRKAQARGYRLVVISNQSGVARGLITLEQVESVNRRMLELLAAERVTVDAVYFCPFHRDGTISEFSGFTRDRKPGAGMAESAALDCSLDLRASAVIGDRATDLHLAGVLGCFGGLVRTGYGLSAESKLCAWEKQRFSVFDTLADAVDSLIGRS
jgi:heptosyltransferase-2